ncbi:MAG: STAS-like domain-containing protein [Treponema sp.]|uniref:STAS-like domain-containing protein n=1 Tax=Treponema sp. TaxID=166 RepID=UPI00298E1702|nr:STAS-like domain-containing protein [Treponema sp.]MCQ2601860.1 STAS-like domain-containing protein [Treponema sp.]
MILPISNFGEVLMSRPAGKDAFLMAKAYILNSLSQNDEITLDFDNVKVLTPSWADEFITGLKNNYSNTIRCVNTTNESVDASLKTVLK